MKRMIYSLCCAIGIICVLFVIHLVSLDKTEWTLREKKYNLSIPIVVREGTIDEIEKQATDAISKFGSDICLSSIRWETETHNGFEKLTDGHFVFEYYQNIGNANEYYSYDRYVQYEVNVDLGRKEITEVRKYGNFQLSGKKLEKIPDLAQVRRSINTHWEDKGVAEPYKIQKCRLSIDAYNENLLLICKIKDNNGTEKEARGRMDTVEYVFIESLLDEQKKLLIDEAKKLDEKYEP